MRTEPLLTVAPVAAVQSVAELYAIALTQAETAATHYQRHATAGDTASGDTSLLSTQSVFEVLARRERQRAEAITVGAVAALNKPPDAADLLWSPTDLVPAQEISEIGDSSLGTAYDAWALAVRHRERAFVFWTYVAALAGDPTVRSTAEGFAREALRDGDALRRERRLAWRSLRHDATGEREAAREPASAALLESLLLKDIMAWAAQLTPSERGVLMTLAPSPLPPDHDPHDPLVAEGSLDEIKSRALRRAEQLSNLYLEDADRALDQAGLEFAQRLAAQSIARLAALRSMAATG
ncbi:conserved hypothetical protein [Rhodopseudomonas palustris BisB18]|uniref:Uncharacterized protein n=2 Tax=Rhodopseudomonas palustris TaxID=1076 RepID=Q21C85_RHOPB